MRASERKGLARATGSTKRKLYIEIWQPVNNPALEERHHYPGTRYVFGLNPKLISERAYRRILRIFERELSTLNIPNLPTSKP